MNAKASFRRAVLPMAVVLCASCAPQLPPRIGGLRVQVEPMPKAHDAALKKIGALEAQLRAKAGAERARRDSKLFARNARRLFVRDLTLEAYFASITPASREWFAAFFNAMNKDAEPFDRFFERHKRERLGALGDRRRATVQSRSAAASAVQPMAACGPSTQPYISNVTDSKLVHRYSYGCEPRLVMTTPDQALLFRGRHDQSASPYFPDYPNTYCDDCCGPAAGQSILEWFNVPVRWADGDSATTTMDIQHRLANLMDTEDGVDYTHPDDLGDTLMRDEFVGSKGYCYMPGEASSADLKSMLAAGTPVILLLAWDDNAHYVTVYGYDQSAGRFKLANDTDFAAEELYDRWDFSRVDWYVDAAFAATGVDPNTLFSYSPDGCDQNWPYVLSHEGVALDEVSLAQLYFESFNAAYTSATSEQSTKINFFGDFTWTFGANFVVTPVTKVSDGHRLVSLRSGHDHVISAANPTPGLKANNSVGLPIGIEARVDRRFLDTYPELHAGFRVRDASGAVVLDRYRPFASVIDVGASSSDPANYVFKLSVPYQASYSSAEFVLHGGMRRADWSLAGCLIDRDGDLLCDDADPDKDNDAVPDANDNCPSTPNPGQEATHDPSGAVGDACWLIASGALDLGRGVFHTPDQLPAGLLDKLYHLGVGPGASSNPDPCKCNGLCMSCPADAAAYGTMLTQFARKQIASGVSSKTFMANLEEFVGGLRALGSAATVQNVKVTDDGGLARVSMKVASDKGGEISVRIPEVIVASGNGGLRTLLDNKEVLLTQAGGGGATVLSGRVGPGDHILEILPGAPAPP